MIRCRKIKPEDKQREYWTHIFNIFDKPFNGYRVENKIGRGIPDFAYIYKGVCGWIEFKVAKMTVNKGRVHFKHFTPEQRRFNKVNKSKTIFLFLRVGPSDFILDHTAIEYLKGPIYYNEIARLSLLELNNGCLEGIHERLNPAKTIKLMRLLKGKR